MSTNTVLEALEAARKLIEDEDHWNKGEYAVDGDGMRVGPTSYRAYSYCAIGALCAATKKGARRVYFHPAYQALEKALPQEIADFNDSHTHAEVLAAFDAAIAAEKPKVEVR